MRLLVEEQRDLPLCDVAIVIPVGAAADPPGREGLARVAAELARRGAAGLSREQIDLRLDGLGAGLDVEVRPDSVTFTARCLARNLEALVALLADVLARPAFAAEELGQLVRESLGLLDEIRDDDAALCGRFFERFSLPGHPYGRTGLGTEASLAAIGRDDAAAWWRAHVRPDALVLGFAGDLDEARARALGERLLAGLPAAPASAAAPDPGEPALVPGRRTYLIDKPERAQSQVLIGHAAPRHGDPAWLALHVGATAFGGMFTSRLMTEVRVKRGWSYGAGCRIGRARHGHSFRIRLFPAAEQTPDAIALVLAMWEELAARGIAGDELDLARRHLAGSWAFEIDTASERLSRRLETLLLDLPPPLHERFAELVAAVPLEEVNRALRDHLHPDAAAIVVTGTAANLLPRLAPLPLGPISVVPYDTY